MMIQEGGRSIAGRSSVSCQDCGNQSKRDCDYMRCRTCCKSRGFQCQTHVKSTWIPAYRRHQRHHQHLSSSTNNQPPHQLQDLNPKRHRQNPSSSGLEVLMGDFPAQVDSPATFRCVRVSSTEDEVNQYAYQTSVKIGGHVFKGILYDHGPESSRNMTGESSSSEVLRQQNVISSSSFANVGTNNNAAFFDPSSSYPFTLINASIPGTHVALDRR